MTVEKAEAVRAAALSVLTDDDARGFARTLGVMQRLAWAGKMEGEARGRRVAVDIYEQQFDRLVQVQAMGEYTSALPEPFRKLVSEHTRQAERDLDEAEKAAWPCGS